MLRKAAATKRPPNGAVLTVLTVLTVLICSVASMRILCLLAKLAPQLAAAPSSAAVPLQLVYFMPLVAHPLDGIALENRTSLAVVFRTAIPLGNQRKFSHICWIMASWQRPPTSMALSKPQSTSTTRVLSGYCRSYFQRRGSTTPSSFARACKVQNVLAAGIFCTSARHRSRHRVSKTRLAPSACHL